ncbi:MAG: DinB family protein [Planctomycetes bacterium]|nr:DinB family protein [Planctomycetota bacterium]
MYTPEALLDLHERAHRSLQNLLAHCRRLSAEELDRAVPGFGYASVRLQLHHVMSAQEYWLGVLQGRSDPEDNEAAYPTLDALAGFRQQVAAATDAYLRRCSREELNTPRLMITWQKKEQRLVPALVVLRTLTHLYQHQGQITAMCRLLGKPAAGMDFPIAP